jgi:nucleotide-binding universal stress UspA family protein
MYKRILIVVDQRQVSRAAVQEGLRLAASHDSEVTFFTALPRFPLPIAEAPYFDAASHRDFELAAQANADKLLAASRVAADKAQVKSRGIAWRGDDDALGIVDAARRRRCELIVVASEGRNALMRLLTGSVIPGLITASPIPVLVCKPIARGQPAARQAVVPLRPRAAPKRAAAAAAGSLAR